MPDPSRFKDMFDRLVSLTDREWARIVADRPIINGKRDAVISVLQAPDFVNEDREGGRREQFYRWTPLPPLGGAYLRVTVDCGRFGPNLMFWRLPLTVIDAAIVKGESPKEKRKWPKDPPGQHPT